MFKKVVIATCLLLCTNAAYRGPLAGGLPASLYPAGVDPRTCPNFPECTNPAVAAIQNYPQYQTSPSYQNQIPYQPRHTSTPLLQRQTYYEPEFEFVPSSRRAQQQYTQPQYAQPQYTEAQYYNPPQHYAGNVRDRQYTPEEKRALDRGEYIGDGDYHGEGLVEALAPEYQGFSKEYIRSNPENIPKIIQVINTTFDIPETNTNVNKTNYYHNKTIDEFQKKIDITKNILIEMKPLLCNQNLSIQLRTSMTKYLISSTLYNEMENKTLTQSDMSKLEAFEKWTCRKILNVSWAEKLRDIEIFYGMDKELITKSVKTTDIYCQGQIYTLKGTKYALVYVTVKNSEQGKIRTTGRKKTFWLQKLREMYGCTSVTLYMNGEIM